MPAIVIAGGRLDGIFAESAGTTIKALAPVNGRPLIESMLSSLRTSPSVGIIVVVGPIDELSAALDFHPAEVIIDEGRTGPENVQRGLEFLREKFAVTADRVLICTSDLPFATTDAIEKLLGVAQIDADIAYPIVEKSVYEAAYPGSPNTFARLAAGNFTGCGVMIVRPAALTANALLIEAAFRVRKSQLGMARLLGFPFVIRFLTRKLTIEAAEKRASTITGCYCVAVLDAPVELALDVDSLADYEYARSRNLTRGIYLD